MCSNSVEDCVEKNEGIYNQISLQDAKKQAKIYAVDRASLQSSGTISLVGL
jgi:hypothetical protein